MLAGPAIKLGPLRAEDSDLLFAWINNPDLVRLNAPYRPVSRDSHQRWFQGVGSDNTRVVFGIRLQHQDLLIGTVQLTAIHPVHRNAELIIRIGEGQHQGRGYGKEALSLALDFAWRDLNLHRVFLHVFASNERAIRSYRGAGFSEEGRLRDAAFINGEWCDLLVMGVLRSEVAHARPV